MLHQSYSEHDLKRLTLEARKSWGYDLDASPKTINRINGSSREKVPIQAIYRMVAEDWSKDQFNRFHFPFANSNFARVLGLAEGWDIPVQDRKFLEKDFVLFASDGRTILVLPEKERRWWESTWFNVTSIGIGLLGLLSGAM